MKLPDNKAVRLSILFASQLVSYFVLTANFRAIAHGLYFWTALTDLWITFQGMLLTKLLIEDERTRSWLSIAAFAVGGACGSLLSIWATKQFGG